MNEVTILGLDQLKYKLGKIQMDMQRTALRAIEDSADEITTDIKNIARSAFVNEPTDYIDSITVEEVPEGKKISSTSDYANAVEFGHAEKHFVPLVYNGEITNLGQWAIKRKGFRIITAKAGNIYLVNEQGNHISGFEIQTKGVHPFRAAYYRAAARLMKFLKSRLPKD